MPSKPKPHRPIITDAAGRQWRVYEYSIFAGKSQHFSVGSGSGQYRGFEPLDGGARRSILMSTLAENPATDDALLRQLAESELLRLDDPVVAAARGKLPERVDPPGK